MMRLSLKETRLGLRNSTTRIPFRYGSACLTRCPQAVLAVTIECDGKLHRGYSGDCLPPGWFDKSPAKNYSRQIDDMLAIIKLAEKTYAEEFASPSQFFPAWMISYERIQSRAAEWQFTPLLAGFGSSLVERAIIDALCRAAGMSFFEAVRTNLLGIFPEEVHGQPLAGVGLRSALPPEPPESVFVRHTVGLGDPLTLADVAQEDLLEDGFPQTLEQYVQQTGLRYFKIKVSNQLDHDLQRLATIAELVERHHGAVYHVTLDGNEQYKTADQFQQFVDSIRNTPQLQTMWANTICIEQPLERGIALDPTQTRGIHELASEKAVIIDESDGTLDAYRQAIELGYRGVSSKNCKGPVRSLLNACLTWVHNGRGQRADYLITGEDLCTVGVVPVQSDLCLIATLGLSHVERNGHHYHPGLSYLPTEERQAALEAHGDFYAEQHGIVAPNLVDGQFQIGSLQCVGYGFAVPPNMDSMESADDWEFTSLGLEEQ